MINNDLKRTIHYTTKAQEICNNLLKYIPNDAQLIEPFCGQGDLVKLFPNHNWELYDILNTYENVNIQDTLLNPPEYKNKWVITNPPFLAKNKATDKTLFRKYPNLDDLYKISIKTLMECEGGILIVPLNFLTDEYSANLRSEFLSKFVIDEINAYTTPIFISTTYTVCAFAFHREDNIEQNIFYNIFPQGAQFTMNVKKQYNYSIGGQEFQEINNITNIFSRLTSSENSKYPTNIKLYAIDTRTQKIRVEYDENRYIGKSSDRTYLTFICDKELDIKQQKELANLFNTKLNELREKYKDLCFTNYRDYGRKRIGFTFAYQLMSKCYNELENK